jgi:D-sedoheptulose 7-phosphate isomerase
MNKNELLREIDSAYSNKHLLDEAVTKFQKIIILGNGGSQAVASHISQDYSKKLGKQAFTFSDPSRLTCYINDFGMENANVEFLKQFADKETLVVIISSSGNSPNMVNAVTWCDQQQVSFISLTGFSRENKMNSFKSDFKMFDFWVDSSDYGIVECVHQIFLHSIL